MKRKAWYAGRHEAEDGFTLVEAVVAVAILGIIGVAIAGAFIVSARTNNETTQRYKESHDAQIASAYLATDVQSSDYITSPCSGSALVSFRYSDGSIASYSQSGDSILRTFGSCGSTTTTPLVRFAGNPPTLDCTPACAVGDKPTKVKITISESSGYSYSLAGSRRINKAAGSVTSVGVFPPLVALGAAGISIDLPNNGRLRVGGDAIVNGDVKVHQNNDVWDITGELFMHQGEVCNAPVGDCPPPSQYRQTLAVDPLAGLTGPPTGPTVFVYDTPYSPSGGSIPPGIYILNQGYSQNGGGNVVGDGVLLYIAGGQFSLSGNASLSLTPPVGATPYSELGMVIWQPASRVSQPALSFQGSGGASALDGLVYAPNAAAHFGGNGSMRIQNLIVGSVDMSGGGDSGAICVNMPAPCP